MVYLPNPTFRSHDSTKVYIALCCFPQPHPTNKSSRYRRIPLFLTLAVSPHTTLAILGEVKQSQHCRLREDMRNFV